MFVKKGEHIELSSNAVQDPNSVIPMIDDKILDSMRKYAANLNRIAPKADDFLYFAAVMMHAAEAALVNEDGTPKLTRDGKVVEAHWDTADGTWRWVSNDPNLRPVKNANGDIFPESELIKAHKKWKEKPLCIDHKSNSVDHTRGIIVDTYYDRNLKRVIALCALDKANYPELAKKVSSGLSNSVSMGTGVGRAICYDCGQVARVEADFCKHMQTKSGYGEINIDLSPIELSIVVNGADPHAKIKHIIASANAMGQYLSQKEQEMHKLGQSSAHDGIAKIKSDLDTVMQELAKLEDSLKDESTENDTHSAFGPTHSTIAMPEPEREATDFSLAPPHQRFASDVNQAKEHHKRCNCEQTKCEKEGKHEAGGCKKGAGDKKAMYIGSICDECAKTMPAEYMKNSEIANKLALLKEAVSNQLQELTNMSQELSNINQQTVTGNEETMSGKQAKGYFQGGGGLNEPTPGQVKYPADPLNEHLREKEDKQMVGEAPFPEVGDVDGMHPSPSSVEPKDELERKKMLARAEEEERSIRREAAIKKAKEVLSYYQGGGGVNEPALHKVKYPADKLQDQLREKEDKQMVGQKPFPDVGAVDGLHPSPASVEPKDELKRKEMLSRAALKARFVKATKADGSHDLAKSAWQVWGGDKLLLTATVDELTGGRTEALYNTITTESFAKDLMGKVRAYGADKAAALFKSAQAPVPPPAPLGAAPEVPAMPELPGDKDIGDDGDPHEKAVSMLEKARDEISDALEVVKTLNGEQSEMGDSAPELAAADDSKVSTAVLHNMRKDLNADLTSAFNEVLADLRSTENDLQTVVAMYEANIVEKSNRGFLKTVAEETFASAQKTLDVAAELLASFAIYARGTEIITQGAQTGVAMSTEGTDLMSMIENTNKEIEAVAQTMETHDSLHSMLADDLANLDVEAAEDVDANDAVMTDDPAKAAELAKKDPSLQVMLTEASSKEDRLALRAKIASEMKWNPVLYEFHPKGKQTTHLDVKPEGDLAVVENLDEKHDQMMDVATAPPKVRKDAEEIQQLISEGRLDPEKDFPVLLANGVDPETIKYWKQFYGQVGSEGSQFAAELVKEHAKAKMEEEMQQYRVKLARAYELTYDMIDRDLLARDRVAISKNVSELMLINDEGFESYKKVVARKSPAMDKRAYRLPEVGGLGNGESFSQSVESEDLATQLAAAFSTTTKRVF